MNESGEVICTATEKNPKTLEQVTPPKSHRHPHHAENTKTPSVLPADATTFDITDTFCTMDRRIKFSCTMVANAANTFPNMNRPHQLSCTMVKMQPDPLRDSADNIWFVLGAYFFAFFPWALLHNIDFISEKWRTCARTRTHARRHLAGSILPIIYVAVYAEAQRRDEDYKEFGAAIAALMVNVFQLLRTLMGILQLNAFVAWCKDAKECMLVLCGKYDGDGKNDSEQDVGAERLSRGRRCMQQTRKFCGLFQLEKVGTWCKQVMGRIRNCFSRNTQHNDQEIAKDEKDDMEKDIEDVIKVNNTVIDNELWGREVAVLMSWQKIKNGLKNRRFKPSRWFRTYPVMLNTVQWCGAFLCGTLGEQWSVHEDADTNDGEMLKTFFSRDMADMLDILQSVEWNIDMGNGSPEPVSIDRLDTVGQTDLTGEMCTAYGSRFNSYHAGSTWHVGLYTFEFDNLVGSYPANETTWRSGNRESAKVGLAHSLVLAKHFGVEKLKAIRQNYDRYGVPSGPIRERAFRLLCKQTRVRLPEDSEIWGMFECTFHQIPLFPYRMQAVALWNEATNWCVLQASAHQDIYNSLLYGNPEQMEDDQEPLHDAVLDANLFDHCADRGKQLDAGQGPLGVVIETVRTFLAEWIAGSDGEPNWEPEVPKDCFEFDRIGAFSKKPEGNDDHLIRMWKQELQGNLIWVCLRKLQRKVAKMGNEGENLPGNAALIMLFLLGFPLLRMEEAQDSELSWEENQKLPETGIGFSSNKDNSVDVYVLWWRTWTDLAPQKICLLIRLDLGNGRVALKLRNESGDAKFKWQAWVDASMGYLKGIEDKECSELGYGRTILKADLRKPMVELSPLCVKEGRLGPEVDKTSRVRIWMGWLPFDVGICKFELDQWFAACDAKLKGTLDESEHKKAMDEEKRINAVMIRLKAEENAELESSKKVLKNEAT